jgi:hypothetical protein
MPIDRLGSTAALIAALRSAPSRKTEATSRKPRTRGERAETPNTSTPHDITQLRRQLVEQVKDVALDDPESVRHARTRVVRSILLWEFGQEFRDHPEWRPLTDRLERLFDQDDAHRAGFLALLAELKPRK